MATNNACNNIKPLNVVTIASSHISIENYTLYLCTYTSSAMTLVLPTTAEAGSYFILTVMDTAQTVTITQNDGQQIYGYLAKSTTVGPTGSVSITLPDNTYISSYKLYCLEDNNIWMFDTMGYPGSSSAAILCTTYV